MSGDGGYRICADIGAAKVEVEGEDADEVERLFDEKFEEAVSEYERLDDDLADDETGEGFV